MFRHTIALGRIFGIEVDLDYSWFLVFGLLTWILAVSYYPMEYRNWSTGAYWLMGAITSILLFVSVLLHELGHSVVAIHYGIPVPRITLFIFGGVAQIAQEPESALSEFWIAIAGPTVSVLLAAFFAELAPIFVQVSPLLALAKYLALLNFVLAIFNLVPGFPLDGGRIFRAILWGITRSFQRATSIAAVTGQGFGYFFIFAGIWMVLSGSIFNGIWIAFIGWFLESAAKSQIQMQLVKKVLAGHKVSEIMRRDFQGVPSATTLQDLVDNHILTAGRRSFVVDGNHEPSGLVTLSAITAVPRSAWPSTTVKEVMIPPEKLVSVQPNAEAWEALEKMGRDGVNQLPVVMNGGIVGMVSRDDLLHYLSLRQAFSR
jgi:Zn-dependent protease/CBS domain-containing protein